MFKDLNLTGIILCDLIPAMKYFIRALSIMSIVSSWSVTALEDGKVTATEATALITDICKVLKVQLTLDLTDKT